MASGPTAASSPSSQENAGTRPVVHLVVPVLDEERYLEVCVETLLDVAVRDELDLRIVVVDNGSTDATWAIASDLADRHETVVARRLERPGRGGALRCGWSGSGADIVAYTDVDLSGDVGVLASMIDRVWSGGADVVIASRLARGAVVTRSRAREVMSRGYSGLLRVLVDPPFRDPQCGLKVARATTVAAALPSVRDDGWFFDTELLLTAWGAGAAIVELPVTWVERRDSRVRVPSTVLHDLTGLSRVIGERVRAGDGRSIRRAGLPLGVPALVAASLAWRCRPVLVPATGTAVLLTVGGAVAGLRAAWR